MDFLDLKKAFSSFKLFFSKLKTAAQKTGPFFFSEKVLFISCLFILSVFVNFIFVFQPLKAEKWLSKIYKKPFQQTLQKVDGPLVESDMDVRILKVKHEDKIYLEFLSKQPDDSYLKINSVELKGNRDGYFEEYGGKVASLFLLDHDGDGRLDVLAPTFDRFFFPRSNYVVYNEKTGKFELKSEFAYPKIIRPDFRGY